MDAWAKPRQRSRRGGAVVFVGSHHLHDSGRARSPATITSQQHLTDGRERRNANWSGPGHEGSHHTRGSRDGRFHAQHYVRHYQGHRGARGQGFKGCDELGGLAGRVVVDLEGVVGGDGSGGSAVAGGVPIAGGVMGGGPSVGGTVGLDYNGSHDDSGRLVPGHECLSAGGVCWRNRLFRGSELSLLW